MPGLTNRRAVAHLGRGSSRCAHQTSVCTLGKPEPIASDVSGHWNLLAAAIRDGPEMASSVTVCDHVRSLAAPDPPYCSPRSLGGLGGGGVQIGSFGATSSRPGQRHDRACYDGWLGHPALPGDNPECGRAWNAGGRAWLPGLVPVADDGVCAWWGAESGDGVRHSGTGAGGPGWPGAGAGWPETAGGAGVAAGGGGPGDSGGAAGRGVVAGLPAAGGGGDAACACVAVAHAAEPGCRAGGAGWWLCAGGGGRAAGCEPGSSG